MIRPNKNVEKLNRLKDFGSDRNGFIRMDRNERTTGFPEKAYQAMMASLSNEMLTMYPDQTSFYKKLSRFLNVPESNLLLSSGSDAAIKMIFETYVAPQDEVVFLDPTYAMVDVYAQMFDARVTKVGYSANLELQFSQLLASITERTRVVFIANPNQPTGSSVTESQIRQLLEKTHSTNSLLVFDEAYQQFSSQPSTIRFVDQYPQLIVLQTFSKALGLAALRLGFMVSQAENINWLYRVKSLADINAVALKCGEYLLDNYNIVDDYVKSVLQAKAYLAQEFAKLGVQSILGDANFIHLKFPNPYDIEAIARSMKSKGYLIRTTGVGLPAVMEGCIRLTVGPLEQMQQFFRDFLVVFQQVCPA